MADHDRWTEDRDRGRYGEDSRGRPGFEQYGRRGDYGAGGRDRQGYGGYAAGGDGEAYGDYGRSFERRLEPPQDTGGSAYGAGYGLSGPRYGQEGHGQRPHGGGDHNERYGGVWGRHPYEHGEQGAYSGWNEGPQAQGSGAGYNPASRYGPSEDYARTHGYGGQGWRGQGAERGHDGGHDRTWMERTGERIASWFAGEREGMGRHRGRGPKNYTRSDERIREDINDRLTDDAWLDATEIEVQVANGEVTLSGTVESREDRRRAEDIAEQAAGVKHVQNNLRVQPHQGQTQGQGDGGATSSATSGSRTTAPDPGGTSGNA